MSSTPIQADLTLWTTLRTRRRKVTFSHGLDAVATRWLARLRHSRRGSRYLRREAEAVVAVEAEWSALSDEALDQRIAELREVFACRRHEASHVRLGFAAVREVAWRTTGQRPFMVQIMGAMGLYHGQIVEMVTGEGKTLTASLAAVLLGWTRRPVHIITVNDYLAQRDAESRQPIYRRCGLSAGAVINPMPEPDRLATYRQPIVYASAKEIMADWLRDQLRLGRIADPVATAWLRSRPWGQATGGQGAGRPQGPGVRDATVLVPGLGAVIVDEIDAILIDEAVTPLIIAQNRQDDPQQVLYKQARDFARQLKAREHFTVRAADHNVELTSAGREVLHGLISPEHHAIWRAARRREELVAQALTAEHCYHLGQQYQISEEKVVIVDEYTGRFMTDRQWQNGLHQAVEAKHDLPITVDRDTLASISFQRFYRQYPHLCGMTGTAADARPELERTYGLPVRVIPTNRPVRRERKPDLIFARAAEKWEAAAAEVARLHAQGRPVLVGTRSVEASEHLSRLLAERGLEHQVLNAVHHELEAGIIARAGHQGTITVATNMAGRGTDITLAPGVAEKGGLHVVLTERHTARRIDRQFIGRSGRQGDPGSAQILVSLEDDLVTKFAPRGARLLRWKWRASVRSKAGQSASEPGGTLPAWAGRLFDFAQRAATRRAFKTRLILIRQDYDLDKSLPG